MADLVLRGGRVIDPASGRDETADIALDGGKVIEIGRDLPAGDAETVDVRGLLVVPGLIDLHTHVYWGATSLGVDAAALRCIFTTSRNQPPAVLDSVDVSRGWHGVLVWARRPSPLVAAETQNISMGVLDLAANSLRCSHKSVAAVGSGS